MKYLRNQNLLNIYNQMQQNYANGQLFSKVAIYVFLALSLESLNYNDFNL